MKELGFFATLSSSSKCFCSIYTTSVFFFLCLKNGVNLVSMRKLKRELFSYFLGKNNNNNNKGKEVASFIGGTKWRGNNAAYIFIIDDI